MLGIAGLRAVTGLFNFFVVYFNMEIFRKGTVVIYLFSDTYDRGHSSTPHNHHFNYLLIERSKPYKAGYKAGKTIYFACRVAVWGTRQGRIFIYRAR